MRRVQLLRKPSLQELDQTHIQFVVFYHTCFVFIPKRGDIFAECFWHKNVDEFIGFLTPWKKVSGERFAQVRNQSEPPNVINLPFLYFVSIPACGIRSEVRSLSCVCWRYVVSLP